MRSGRSWPSSWPGAGRRSCWPIRRRGATTLRASPPACWPPPARPARSQVRRSFPLLKDARDGGTGSCRTWRGAPDRSLGRHPAGPGPRLSRPRQRRGGRHGGRAHRRSGRLAARARPRRPAGPFLFTRGGLAARSPQTMLDALHATPARSGGRADAPRRRTSATAADGGQIGGDVLIQATGPGNGDLARSRARSCAFPALARPGPVVRGEGVYVAPWPSASSSARPWRRAGRPRDRSRAVASARRGGRPPVPRVEAAGRPRQGRGAGGDARRPAPGRTRQAREGCWCRRGARRNGWLLAPLVAEVLLDRLTGGPPRLRLPRSTLRGSELKALTIKASLTITGVTVAA